MTRFVPTRPAVLLALAALTGLGACSSSDKAPNLMTFRNSTAQPDEFAIVPARPLETPQDTSVLPTPTPGSGNRADQTPVSDAITALGGTVSALEREGIPSGDGALVTHVSRYGADPAIRDTLAAEDLAWRQRRGPRLLERWARVNVYYDAYEPQWLNQQAELQRLRAAGVRVPTAPPAELKPQ